MEVLDLLLRFLFDSGSADLRNHQFGAGVFSIACGLIGLVVISADCALYLATKKSVLNIQYSFPKSVSLWLIWGLGAALVGFLANITGAVQLNLQASAMTGIGWPLIMPRLVAKLESESGGEAIQEATEEVEGD